MLHSSNMLIGGHRTATFICSDDEARGVIAGLVDDIGSQPADADPLVNSRYTEPTYMPAYTRGFGSRIGISLMRESAETAVR